MEEVFVVLGFFGFAACFVYYHFTTRHKERMELIKSGQSADLFKSTPQGHGALKWGLMLVFLGAAVGIGIFMDLTLNNDGPFITFPLTLLGGGAGLLFYYFLIKREKEEL